MSKWRKLPESYVSPGKNDVDRSAATVIPIEQMFDGEGCCYFTGTPADTLYHFSFKKRPRTRLGKNGQPLINQITDVEQYAFKNLDAFRGYCLQQSLAMLDEFNGEPGVDGMWNSHNIFLDQISNPVWLLPQGTELTDDPYFWMGIQTKVLGFKLAGRSNYYASVKLDEPYCDEVPYYGLSEPTKFDQVCVPTQEAAEALLTDSFRKVMSNLNQKQTRTQKAHKGRMKPPTLDSFRKLWIRRWNKDWTPRIKAADFPTEKQIFTLWDLA